MSYDVQLYRKETMNKERKSKDENFFDNENNLEPFTDIQRKELHERLLKYNYVVVKQEHSDTLYEFEDGFSISALLTHSGLYFQTAWNEDGVFEIGMTASEFTDTGDFVKYDPQNGGWEDID